MLSKTDFDNLLTSQGPLVIDGALATELEVRGHDLNHPLWSGKILQDEPKSIENVHLDYYLAGADVAITASYQTATQGLTDHFRISEDEAKALIRRSVEVAQNARREAYDRGVSTASTLLVAGSVGPYGAYLHDGSEYRGDYVRTQEEFKDFHRPRIQALVEAEVDLLALETIPSLDEIKALLSLLQEEFPDAIAWLSFTTRDAGHLADGTSWKEAFVVVDDHRAQVVAIGVNCVPLAGVTETLQGMGAQTDIPLLCYPNSGEKFDSATNSWHGERPDDVLGKSSEQHFDTKPWTSAGAQLIGGCCRTGPGFVTAISSDLRAL
ncbi:hypothetical protein M409DRAFT_18576 [Zasmidium cellare ATCC 36951]|uniref:Hcy-binding domain-containing protein n=1 Tax=Zasmidium cellare ATCC 36951 TaxID=1080233 RepID=A0A6A6D050_ZASCE|nr:uncharacterized protein M409DRAFT_18576 [Zasmidium cellare ATCC 36951]KAF2171459.1 hypothetical protein M409DRAFT_18576 [Zasmidium cellare ATCC 36951]